MEILGIGPLELFFIIIIALIVLGPKDMVKAGKTIGRFLRKLVSSESWRTIQQTSRDLKRLPNKLMNEAGLDELEKDLSLKEIQKDLGLNEIEKEIGLNEISKNLIDIQKDINKDLSDWTTPPEILTQNHPAETRPLGDKLEPESKSEPDFNPETLIDNPSQTTPNT